MVARTERNRRYLLLAGCAFAMLLLLALSSSRLNGACDPSTPTKASVVQFARFEPQQQQQQQPQGAAGDKENNADGLELAKANFALQQELAQKSWKVEQLQKRLQELERERERERERQQQQTQQGPLLRGAGGGGRGGGGGGAGPEAGLVFHMNYPIFAAQSYYATRTSFDRHFALFTGVEGSGTTFLAKTVLPEGASDSVVYRPQHDKNRKWFTLGTTNHNLWSSGPVDKHLQAKNSFPTVVTEEFAQFPSHKIIVVHRSIPDFDTAHYPDLSYEFNSLLSKANIGFKLVIVFRDPRDSAYSNYRRGWPHIKAGGKADVLASARSTERHLCLLNQQLQTFHPDDYLVINYNLFLEHPEPFLRQLCDYLEIPEEFDSITATAKRLIKPPHDRTTGLKENEQLFLDQFFNEQRTWKWKFLEDKSRAIMNSTYWNLAV
ncbi:Trichoplein keratin filament-binding protein [Balamuthia mandrillaris]